jgi:guanylate kinase
MHAVPDFKIVIVSAPSGAGKTTIVRSLLQTIELLEFSVSATTRSPRAKEVEGRDYYFISLSEFDRLIAEDAFVEWEEVYPGRKYGTLYSELRRIANDGQFPIFDVDVKGGLNLKKIFQHNALSLFVKPPSIEVLEERLRRRGTDSEAEIQMRLQKAVEELSYAEQFDHIITNESLDKAVAQAQSLTLNFIQS